MKKLSILLVFALGILLTSCEKDKHKEDKDLTVAFLEQTVWKGGVSIDGVQMAEVGIEFTSHNRGIHEYTDFRDERQFPKGGYFKYEVNKKILKIYFTGYADADNLLEGNWMLVEKGKDRLVLTHDLYSEPWVLELNKIY